VLRLDSGDESTRSIAVVDETARYFSRALVEDHAERTAALKTLCLFLMRDDHRALLQVHLARLVRMASSCPLRDWKSAATQLVQHARNLGMHPPTPLRISRYFAQSEMVDDQCEDADVRALFREQFLDSGRLSYLHRLLALKSDYAAHLYSVQRQLMREAGQRL
jgi:hypothetical protein